MCRPGWGEYSASCLMSWTPTWAKVTLQLTAPCWQKAWLEAWFPPAQLYWDCLNKSIALPCKPSACHWLRAGFSSPLGPTGTKRGEVKFQVVLPHPASRICAACPGARWLLWEVDIHSLSTGCLCVLVLLLLGWMIPSCLLRQQRGSFLTGVWLHEGRYLKKWLSALLCWLFPLATGNKLFLWLFFFFCPSLTIWWELCQCGMDGRQRESLGTQGHAAPKS